MRSTPPATQIARDLSRAQTAVGRAKTLRLRLRRNSNPGGERESAIAAAIAECASAARPIRRYIGMLAAHPELEPYDERLRAISQQLTYERRLLRKMRR